MAVEHCTGPGALLHAVRDVSQVRDRFTQSICTRVFEQYPLVSAMAVAHRTSPSGPAPYSMLYAMFHGLEIASHNDTTTTPC